MTYIHNSAPPADHWASRLEVQSIVPRLIILVMVILSFEETIGGVLNLGPTPFALMKLSTELLLYSALLAAFALRLSQINGTGMTIGRLELLLFLFGSSAMVGILLNSGSAFSGLVTIRTGFRYLAIFYIIVLLRWCPTERDLRQIFGWFIALMLVQVFFILLQHILGDGFREQWFAPPQVEVAVADIDAAFGAKSHRIGAGYGTLGRPAAASIALLLAAVIALTVHMSEPKRYRLQVWSLPIFFIIAAGIVFTYKRGPVILYALSPFLILWILGRLGKLVATITLAGIVVVAAFNLLTISAPTALVKADEESISPIQLIMQFASSEYWERNFDTSRGWMITQVGGDVISSTRLFGYGADQENAQERLARKGGEFAKLVGWGAFNDVYVVASLVYFGPVGVALFVLFLQRIYGMAAVVGRNAISHAHNSLSVATRAIIWLLLPLLFLERALELRLFSFFFFVLLGTTVSTYYGIRRGRYGRPDNAPLRELSAR